MTLHIIFNMILGVALVGMIVWHFVLDGEIYRLKCVISNKNRQLMLLSQRLKL